jgi:hypothetical protein
LHSFLYKKKFDRLYTILQKNGGTETKAMGQTEPQFLSDPNVRQKKKIFANSGQVRLCILLWSNVDQKEAILVGVEQDLYQ